MTQIRETLSSAPEITPAPSNILDHARVTDIASFGLRTECGMWQSYNCMDTLAVTPLCPDAPEEKDFGFAEWMPGFAFAVYGGVQCKLIGLDRAEQAREIKRVFRANEAKGIERALMQTRFIASSAAPEDEPCGWEAATDLTPTSGTPVSPKTGLALLEGYAGQVYAGVPTLHLPRSVVSYLGDHIGASGGSAAMHSRVGSKVVNGAGYEPSTGPDGAATDDATQVWLYASGEVAVERGPLEVIDVVKMPGTSETIDDNTALALVERPYRVTVDCFTAAVLVEMT